MKKKIKIQIQEFFIRNNEENIKKILSYNKINKIINIKNLHLMSQNLIKKIF